MQIQCLRITLLGFFLAGFWGIAGAQTVSETEATRKATLFLQQAGNAMIQKSAPQCVYLEKKADESPLFYVFNGNGSFVIVSGEKQTKPILAYSFSHTFDPDHIIPPVRMWLDHYKAVIEATKNSTFIPDKAWATTAEDSLVWNVEPMLSSLWGQGFPYNYYCPKDEKNNTGRCVTGCVATALAQIAYYFRWPETGTGSYQYIHENYGLIASDFSQARYNYGHMCDNPAQINAAASQLIAHFGTAVDMVYGPNGSGMTNHKAAYVLRTYFKYHPGAQYIFRDSTNYIHDSLQPTPRYQHWDSTIRAHLDQHIPLYYAGWTEPWTDGHAFVCDGYQLYQSGDCYFHFNFGWDGNSDAYFLTSNLSPSSYDFNLAQELVVNAWPDTTRYSYPSAFPLQGEQTLRFRTGSFEDGSGPWTNCSSGMDYTWHLRPEADDMTQMRIRITCQLGTGDTLWVSSPDKNFVSLFFTETDSLITWDNLIAEYDFRLVTGSKGESKGIHVSYELQFPEYCLRLTPNTKASGTVSDGSGSHNYGNNTCCEATINVKRAEGIRIRFTEMETEKEADILSFYDMNDSGKLLLSLSGQLEEDSVFFLPSNFVYVVFETNDSITRSGWSFDYTASQTAVSETAEQTKTLRLYPNPAHDKLHIEQTAAASGTVTLLDVMGKIIRKWEIRERESEISVSELPQGIYFIKAELQDGTQIERFIRQ